MKWTILISLLTISAESRNLFKRDSEHHEKRHLGDVRRLLTPTDFRSIVLMTFAQLLPKCSLEEISKHVEQITTLADTCAQHSRHADCGKPLVTLFLDHICAIPELGSTYEWSTECCAKHDPERSDCFNKHKGLAVVTKPSHTQPSPDEVCAAYKSSKEKNLEKFIYMMAIKHPHMQIPAILVFAHQYNTICSECCDEEDKEKCFTDRMAELKKQIYIVQAVQKETCQILDNFKVKVLTARNVAIVSKRFPGASNEIREKIIVKSTHVNVDCCHGNILECLIEVMEFTEHMCNHQEKISSKLKPCCEKTHHERRQCMINMVNEEIPATLSKNVTGFIENPLVCEIYAKDQDKHLLRFGMEYSNRNPALSVQMIMQAGKGYQDLLNKCCPVLNPLECLKKGEELLINGIKESKELLEKNCADYDKLGDYMFQNDMIYHYVKRMPQVSTPGMMQMTEKMTEVAKHCCHLPEEDKIACADLRLGFIMGEMCELEKTHPINEGVKKCCWDSYSERRPCFTALSPDESYVAPEITSDTFSFTEELCTNDVKKLQQTKQGFLIELLKLKPKLSLVQLNEIIGKFIKMREKCCAAKNIQVCFKTEGPILKEHGLELAV